MDYLESIEKIKEIVIETFEMHTYGSTHGVSHWIEVHKNAKLLSLQDGVDKLVVVLFAYLHDCQRFDDNEDPEHGGRAAEYVELLRDNKHLDFLSNEQLEKLVFACKHHSTGVISDDITIGACYDADRIELIRSGVNIVPNPELMSTPLGKRIAEKMQDTKNYMV